MFFFEVPVLPLAEAPEGHMMLWEGRVTAKAY